MSILVCINCGSTETLEDIQKKNFISCCPERHVVDVEKLYQENHQLKDTLRELIPYVDTNGNNNKSSNIIKKAEELLK